MRMRRRKLHPKLPWRARMALRLMLWGHDKFHQDEPDERCAVCMAEQSRREDDVRIEMASVLEPSAIERWMDTPIPALDNATPRERIAQRRMAEVLDVVAQYKDGAFG